MPLFYSLFARIILFLSDATNLTEATMSEVSLMSLIVK